MVTRFSPCYKSTSRARRSQRQEQAVFGKKEGKLLHWQPSHIHTPIVNIDLALRLPRHRRRCSQWAKSTAGHRCQFFFLLRTLFLYKFPPAAVYKTKVGGGGRLFLTRRPLTSTCAVLSIRKDIAHKPPHFFSFLYCCSVILPFSSYPAHSFHL